MSFYNTSIYSVGSARSIYNKLSGEPSVYKSKMKSMLEVGNLNLDFKKTSKYSAELEELSVAAKSCSRKMDSIISDLSGSKNQAKRNDARELKVMFNQLATDSKALSKTIRKTETQFKTFDNNFAKNMLAGAVGVSARTIIAKRFPSEGVNKGIPENDLRSIKNYAIASGLNPDNLTSDDIAIVQYFVNLETIPANVSFIPLASSTTLAGSTALTVDLWEAINVVWAEVQGWIATAGAVALVDGPIPIGDIIAAIILLIAAGYALAELTPIIINALVDGITSFSSNIKEKAEKKEGEGVESGEGVEEGEGEEEWDGDVNNLPAGWTKTENNGRIHVRDADGNMRSRIDPPDTNTDYTHQHRYDIDGNSLDANGNIAPYDSPDSHIPYGG